MPFTAGLYPADESEHAADVAPPDTAKAKTNYQPLSQHHRGGA
jgi:hypothetical protein